MGLPSTSEKVQEKIGGKFADLGVLGSNDLILINSLNEVLLSKAEVFGKQRQKIQPCVANEILDLCH